MPHMGTHFFPGILAAGIPVNGSPAPSWNGNSSLSQGQQHIRPTRQAGNLPLSQALGSQGEDQPDVLKTLRVLRLTCSWQGEEFHSVSMESLPGVVKTEPFQISPSLPWSVLGSSLLWDGENGTL